MGQPAVLTDDDFTLIRTLVRQRSSIVLEAEKHYFAESRLTPLAAKEGFESLAGMMETVRRQPDGPLSRKLVEAMAVRETMWFRDPKSFDTLRTELMPEIIAKRANLRRLNIWSAGCAGGQEVFSLVMLLREHFPVLADWNIQVIASDFSSLALAQANAGRYNQTEMNRGLPAPMLVKHFRKQGLEWQLDDDIRRRVTFREINLGRPWPTLPPMDLVLLRNVLIYFDHETKQGILKRLQRVLQPDGYLLLGGGETTMHLDPAYQVVSFGKAIGFRLRSTGGSHHVV